jgi:hypothetical protein
MAALRTLTLCAIGLLPAIALAAVDGDGRWHLGIGDADATGWITVVAYLATAVLAWLNAQAARRTRLKPGFWLGLAALMLLLGINKQLDLQSLITEIGRDMAKSGGWYEDRRAVQVFFILMLCGAAVGVAIALRHRLAQDWRDYRLAFVGILLLMLFVVVRAVTIHHIDSLLRFDIAGLRINVLLEMTAIAVVAAGCLQWQRVHRRRVREFFIKSLRRQ